LTHTRALLQPVVPADEDVYAGLQVVEAEDRLGATQQLTSGACLETCLSEGKCQACPSPPAWVVKAESWVEQKKREAQAAVSVVIPSMFRSVPASRATPMRYWTTTHSLTVAAPRLKRAPATTASNTAPKHAEEVDGEQGRPFANNEAAAAACDSLPVCEGALPQEGAMVHSLQHTHFSSGAVPTGAAGALARPLLKNVVSRVSRFSRLHAGGRSAKYFLLEESDVHESDLRWVGVQVPSSNWEGGEEIEHLAAACDDEVSCVGFNERGWLKTVPIRVAVAFAKVAAAAALRQGQRQSLRGVPSPSGEESRPRNGTQPGAEGNSSLVDARDPNALLALYSVLTFYRNSRVWVKPPRGHPNGTKPASTLLPPPEYVVGTVLSLALELEGCNAPEFGGRTHGYVVNTTPPDGRDEAYLGFHAMAELFGRGGRLEMPCISFFDAWAYRRYTETSRPPHDNKGARVSGVASMCAET
jgi:hypothetical protein